ncbi:MAG TPA: DUF3854 domain-containing protein [Thermomicrobiales bacterium]|nr:DUF3854 domain-containing protein [Thermomicrobiales bacterium]
MTVTLLDHHRAALDEAGISPEIAEARGYRSITDPDELVRLKFASYQIRVPALLIPGTDPAGANGRYQIRPDHPRIGSNGKPLKYETAASAGIWLDAHPTIQPLLSDVTVPLWLTEGVKKADAAISAGLCCISIQGVWSWRCLSDWAHIALKGRTVFLAFDSDVTSKAEVKEAMTALAAFLTSLGAKVRIITLPPGDDDSKTGLDDYLAAGHTVQDLEALAGPVVRPYHEPEDSEAEQLRLHNHILRERAEALERENAAIRTEYALIRKALANPEVREEVATALAAIEYAAERKKRDRHVGGRVEVHMDDIAAVTGTSNGTVGRHIQRAAAMGVFDRELIRIPGVRGPNGRWEKRPKNEVWVSVDSKEAALHRLAHAQPVEGAEAVEDGARRNHGGARFKCPRCGCEEVVYRPHCKGCGVRLQRGASGSLTIFQDEIWSDEAEESATINQLDFEKRKDMGTQDEPRVVAVQADLWQAPTVETPRPTFRIVDVPPRPPASIQPPAAIIQDETWSAETDPPDPPPDPSPLCARCGRHPALRFHRKCQDCLVTDAIKSKAGGML